jgi:ribosomal protein L40E
MNDVGIIPTAVLIVLYFTPAWFAIVRRHHHAAAIVAVNLFLGVTIIGWVIALIWSLTAVRPAVADEKICMACGAVDRQPANFCTRCGAPFKAAAT